MTRIYLILALGLVSLCARRYPDCRFCAESILLGALFSSATNLECTGNRVLTIHGGGTVATSIYDPAIHNFSIGPNLPAVANPGSVAFQIPNFGPRACQNVVTQGNNTASGYYYNPRTNSFSSYTFSAGALNVGATVVKYRSGTSTRFLIVHGTSTATTIYKPDTDTRVTGPVLPLGPGGGTHSFQVPAGNLTGKYMIAAGGGGANWIVFDPDTETTSLHAAAPLGTNANSAAHQITTGGRTGQFFIQAAGNNPNQLIYIPSSDSFATVATVSIAPNLGSNSFTIANGANTGHILMVAGSGSLIVDKYSPTGDVVAPSGLSATVAVSNGGHNFPITAGVENGNQIIVLSNAQAVNLFRGLGYTMTNPGIQMSGNIGAGSNSVAIAD